MQLLQRLSPMCKKGSEWTATLTFLVLVCIRLLFVIGQWKLHVEVQCFGFGVVCAGPSRGLHACCMRQGWILSLEQADGMAKCGCLPMTINVAVVLTKESVGWLGI